jgi:hypothetical protein
MTTTERPRSPPLRTIGVNNLRLNLLALLAIVYVVVWWMFGVRAPARSAALPPLEAASESSRQPQLATWYQDLPPPERPVVELPVGWRLADRTAPSSGTSVRQVPVPVRVAPTRPGRIRTRSS